MKAKNLCLCAGLVAGCAAVATAEDKPNLQLLDNSINVQPTSVAKFRMEKGEIVRVSDWIELGGGGARGPVDGRVYDCFGDADSDGFMDDTGGCGLSSSRWYFGTAYCNGHATNDMAGVAANEAVGYGRADFGWYWTCGGFGTEECIVVIFTQESNPDACEADTYDYSGWGLNFGFLSCNPGGYYYTNADISSVGTWPAVSGGDGSYIVGFLTNSGTTLATCAQPMLWGDGVDDGGAVANPRGSQETGQLDDDNPLNGTHDTISECYTYSFGVCPDPLGAMMQFWGEPDSGTTDECAYADYNGDGSVNTLDFLAFLGDWSAGNSGADCNDDGQVNTLDFLCFLGEWSACRD